MSERRYTQDEVDAILAAALERRQNGVSHEDLVAAAQEVGIKPSQIEAASRRIGFESEARKIARRRTEARARAFKQRARFVVVISVFFALMNLLAGGGLWAPWAVLPFAFMLALSWIRTSKEEDIEAIADKLEAEDNARIERERREHAKGKAGTIARVGAKAGAVLGTAVGMAVDELLSAAENAIRESKEERKSKGRFGEYVSSQQGDKNGSEHPEPKSRGVRVKERQEPAWDADGYTEEELAEALEELERSL